MNLILRCRHYHGPATTFTASVTRDGASPRLN